MFLFSVWAQFVRPIKCDDLKVKRKYLYASHLCLNYTHSTNYIRACHNNEISLFSTRGTEVPYHVWQRVDRSTEITKMCSNQQRWRQRQRKQKHQHIYYNYEWFSCRLASLRDSAANRMQSMIFFIVRES